MEAPPMLASRRPRPVLPLAAMAAIIAGALVLFLFDPATHGFYPRCLLYVTTGVYCPGCGGLRAMHSLVHGRVLAALRYNALFVLSLPFAAIYALRWLRNWRAGAASASLPGPLFIKLAIVVTIVFTILRNIPAAPFTCLAPP